MKRIHRHAEEIAQQHANEITNIVHRHFRTNNVTRAADLSDEAAIRMNQEIRAYRLKEMDGGPTTMTTADTAKECMGDIANNILPYGLGFVCAVGSVWLLYSFGTFVMHYISGRH